MTEKGGLVSTSRQIDGRYHTHIVMRNFHGQTPDDYHATVTRLNDDVQLVFFNRWKWWLKWRIRRRAIDRAFKRYDKRQAKLTVTEDRVF